MNAPATLKYTASHEWIRVEADGSLTVGITDFAQEQLGDVVFLEFPKVGKRYGENDPCGVIESVKAVSDLNMPVAGTSTAVNEALAKSPEKVNSDAYGSWMFKMQPESAASVQQLLDATAYTAQAEK
jgi:glycine cleavage system H protein